MHVSWNWLWTRASIDHDYGFNHCGSSKRIINPAILFSDASNDLLSQFEAVSEFVITTAPCP
jgi:hypothetical protein